MSILSGYNKYKRYIKTSDGYKLCSHWTSSNTVHFDDNKTAQSKLGSINGISDSLTSTSSNVAASTAAVKALNDKITQTNSNIRIPLTTSSGASAGELDILGKSATLVFNTNLDGVAANHKYTNIFTVPAAHVPCTAVFGVGVIVDANFSVKGEFCIVVNSDGSTILNATISHNNALSYICGLNWHKS